MKVLNMQSDRGREVPNQFIIIGDTGEYFQSYKSVIVFKPFNENEPTQLDETYWDYSRTTSTYRNKFLGEDTDTIKRKIKSGEYVLTNLN